MCENASELASAPGRAKDAAVPGLSRGPQRRGGAYSAAGAVHVCGVGGEGAQREPDQWASRRGPAHAAHAALAHRGPAARGGPCWQHLGDPVVARAHTAAPRRKGSTQVDRARRLRPSPLRVYPPGWVCVCGWRGGREAAGGLRVAVLCRARPLLCRGAGLLPGARRQGS
jgi:hypothetical protein